MHWLWLAAILHLKCLALGCQSTWGFNGIMRSQMKPDKPENTRYKRHLTWSLEALIKFASSKRHLTCQAATFGQTPRKQMFSVGSVRVGSFSPILVECQGAQSWHMAFLGSQVPPNEVLIGSLLSALTCKDLATLEMVCASGLRDLKARLRTDHDEGRRSTFGLRSWQLSFSTILIYSNLFLMFSIYAVQIKRHQETNTFFLAGFAALGGILPAASSALRACRRMFHSLRGEV